MRKLRNLFLGILLVFCLVPKVMATASSEIIENVQIEIINHKLTFGQDVLFKDYWYPYIEESTKFIPIDVRDNLLSYKITVNLKSNFLNAIPNSNNIKEIVIDADKSVNNSCLFGDQTQRFLPGTTLVFADNTTCKKDIFFQGDPIGIQVTVTYNNATPELVYEQSPYSLAVQDRPINRCTLRLLDAAGNALTSANNNDDLTMEISNVDAGSMNSLVISLDGVEAEPVEVVLGQTVYLYHIGFLTVGDHQFATLLRDTVLIDEGGPAICEGNLPIYEFGTTPTPIDLSQSNTSTTTTLTLAEPIALCDAVPEEYRGKCMSCYDGQQVWTALGCLPTDMGSLITYLFTTFSGVLGAFILFCFVSNGLKIMTSRGTPETMKKAQEALTSCVVGFLVLVFSVLFLKVIGVDILQLPGFGS